MKNNKRFVPKSHSSEPNNHLDEQVSRDDKALILPISLIKLSSNVRTALTNIEELSESIKVNGILQALVVAKTPQGLELVAGRRRLEAAKLAGLKVVPVRIANADENQIQTLRLIENIQRENLSPIEEIQAVAALVKVFDGNQDQLAKALGKDKSYVTRCLKAAKIAQDLPVVDPQLNLSKSMLFGIADAKDPKAALEAVRSGAVKSSKDIRKSSGAILGGRYVQGAIDYQENEKNGTFTLRVSYCSSRTPSATKEQIINRLDKVLKILKG
jgi:ParB/RepB/Spo0J family partition protein